MGVVIRQSILTSILSYVGVIIGYINLLYLYPKFLKPDEIGLLRSIQDTAMLFTPFAVFGLGQSLMKYYPYFAKNRNQAATFLNLILVLGVISYGIFFLVFTIFKTYFISFFEKNASALIPYISLILWMTFFLLAVTLLEQFYRSLIQVAFPTFVREILVRVMQGLLVTMYFLGWISFDEFLVYSVLILVIALLILALNLIRQRHYSLRFDYKLLSGFNLRDMITFSALSFIGTSAMILVGKMDSVMVSGMLGFSANAIYTTAFYMATVIEVPKRAITTTSAPVIARAFESNNVAEVGELYRKTSINQFIIGALLLIGVWANLSNIYKLMPNGELYTPGLYVVLIVGSGKLLDMIFGPSSEIIALSPHYWFNLVVIVFLAGIVIVGNYFLIPTFGIEGAAYSSVLALFVYNALKFIFIRVKIGIQPFSLATLKVALITAATILINLALPELTNIIADITYRSAVITLLYGFLVLATRSSAEVSKLFLATLDKLRLKP
jgi:O-antigen/teichoic acid export membrane protein